MSLDVLQHTQLAHYKDGTHPLETELHVYNGIYSIEGLRQAFIDGSGMHDKALAMKPRFSEFYGWADKDKFVEKFGDDVVVFKHGVYQALAVAIPMVLAQRHVGTGVNHHLTPTDEQIVVTHHAQHDDGEFVLGDVPYTKKTPEQEKEEFLEFCKIQRIVFGQNTADRHIALVKKFDNPSAKTDSFKRRFWNAGERVGYFARALRAWDITQNHEDLTKPERQQASKMALEVTARHEAKLEEYRTTMPYVDDFLIVSTGQRREITRARGRI